MQGQDWTPVILRKPVTQNQSLKQTPHYLKINNPDPETNPTVTVTSKLKAAFIQARNACKLNHNQLAAKLSVPVQDIKDLEKGSMSLKGAKQLSLKFEHKMKVKILT